MMCLNCADKRAILVVVETDAVGGAREIALCRPCLIGWTMEWIFVNEDVTVFDADDPIAPIAESRIRLKKIDPSLAGPGDMVSEPGQSGTIRTPDSPASSPPDVGSNHSTRQE